MVARRFVTLTVSFCLVLAVGIARVDRLFAQDQAKKEAQPPTPPKDAPKTDAPSKDAPKSDTAKTTEPAKTQDAFEERGREGDGAASAANPASGPGQDRRRSQGRGRSDRRLPGCRPRGNVDRPTANPRHPDRRAGD